MLLTTNQVTEIQQIQTQLKVLLDLNAKNITPQGYVYNFIENTVSDIQKTIQSIESSIILQKDIHNDHST